MMINKYQKHNYINHRRSLNKTNTIKVVVWRL